MKIIILKYFFPITNLSYIIKLLKLQIWVTLVICGLMLTACDVSTSVSNKSKAAARWQCTEIISGNKVLCNKGKQSVTVTFENLIVPGSVDISTKNFIFDQTFCSNENYENFSKEALECVTELLLNQEVKIIPTPALGEKAIVGKVFTSRNTDVAVTLIKEGLALVKEKATGNYSEYQNQAMNLERGLWKTEKVLSDIFKVKTFVDISVTDGKDLKRRTVKGLRKYHSPDLIRAPLLRNADTSKEEKSSVSINCKTDINITIKLPPKDYELTIFFKPLVRANIYSGPLDSFKEKEMEWQEKFIDVKGGETVDCKLEYETLNFSLVTRGNTKVYSGYIVEGYEIEISSGEKIIFRKREKVDEKKILEKVEFSEKRVF